MSVSLLLLSGVFCLAPSYLVTQEQTCSDFQIRLAEVTFSLAFSADTKRLWRRCAPKRQNW